MKLELDHIAVAAETLEEGRAFIEDALGVRLQRGGKHARFGTHNMLLGLEDGLYLEVIAIDPDAVAPGRPRWFDLDRFEGPPKIGNWICRTSSLDDATEMFPEAGKPLRMTRDDLVWHMAVPETGILPFDDCFPALMAWGNIAHPTTRLPPSGCRLRRLTIQHPDADDLQRVLGESLRDMRVVFKTGAPRISAIFDTPSGTKVVA